MVKSSRGYMGSQGDAVIARVGAAVLDHALSFVPMTLVGFAFGATFGGSRLVLFAGVLFGFLGYFVLLEWLFGKTVGKAVAGIVVVDQSGSAITVRQSLVRNLLRFVDGLFGYALGFVVMLGTEDVQRIGDQAAGTLVVRARR